MKKIILFLSMLTLVNLVGMDKISWTKNYDTALEIAKKENKPIMLIFSQENCNMCDFMKYILFEKKPVIDFMNNNFINVIVDIHKDKKPSGFSVRATPTFYFLNYKNEQIHRKLIGALNDKKFLTYIQKVKASY